METIFEACQKAAGFTNADDTLSVTARMRALREIEGDQGVTVHPRYDMSMGELEDAMHSNSVTVRISAIRAAYAKGQLDGINSVGESLRVAGLL